MPQRVSIEKLVFGGYGLARTDKGALLVSGVAPGETALVEPYAKKGGVALARPLEIIFPAASRRTPPCPLVNICGGCDWLHLAYDAQVSAKREIVRETLERIGRIKDLPGFETVCGPEFAYRHRIQIKISANGRAGFFARNTTSVVTVEHCPLLVTPLNALLSEFAARTVTPPRGPVTLKAIAGDGNTLASWPVIEGRTTSHVFLNIDGRRFALSGNGFFQSNRPLLNSLGSWVKNNVEGDFFFDLYGGSGFFSIMLADRFKKGMLVESVEAEIRQARENFHANGISHIEALAGRAEDLAGMPRAHRIDCLIVDPPRPGLTRSVREAIARIKPKKVLYVSCNPSTQARDIGFLVHKAGYTIRKAALFDFYPNTHHIECAALLTPPGSS
ncbi:MAG: class I SAM-dependent RNA methyltransferase [Chitinispirillaceae bacterium]|nr:class I SAM-dependent RNA methyltransferase [Chitinispirillaceae bacterium]